jgi:osmotically-inducible protein OsmY
MTSTNFKSDARIRQDVLEELERYWHFKPAEIGVEVDAGVVTLTGTVSSYAKVLDAADVTATITGVRGVANELVVRKTGVGASRDTDVAAAVSDAFRRDLSLNDEAVDVIVRDGVVTLRGNVRYWYQRDAAMEDARRTVGVVVVRDEIRIVPPTRTDGDIKDEIRSSIARLIPLAAEHISVDVRRGVVTLRGNVAFRSDKLQADRSAWMTEGVRSVVNSLRATW